MVANLRVCGLAAAAVAGAFFVADRPASAADEITIGAPLPLTGALSPEGEKLKMGYELWLEELEKRGGISVGGVRHKVVIGSTEPGGSERPGTGVFLHGGTIA